MSDLIDRQAAIDVFEILADKMSDAGKTVMAQAVAVLKDLQSEEPERIIKICQRSGKTLESAIDYLQSVGWLQEHDRILTESAEPEQKIIYCKDCRFAHLTIKGEVKYCDVWFPEEKMYLSADDFCSSAEKRGE